MIGRRIVAAVALVAVVVVAGVGAGCGSQRDVDDAGREALAQKVCAAAAAAASNDRSRARSLFDDAHAALHTLADELAASDRQAAGEVLRTKQAVEESLEAPGDVLADRLRALAAAVDDSAACG